jgi:hypothetical protein
VAIAYSSAGTGVSTESSGGALSPTCPATVAAGDILILQAAYEGTTTAPVDPGGWTPLFSAQSVGVASVVARHWVYGKIADGSEDGAAVALGTPAVTTQRAARIYSFSGRVSGSITDLVPVASFTNTPGDTDPTGPTVVTTIAGSLACALVYQHDNNTLETFASASDTWTERGTVGGFIFALTPGGVLDLLTATPAADPGTVSGGAMTVTNDPWSVIGFEIRPSVPVTNFNSTGDLAAQSSAIEGTGIVGRTSTGALAAQSSAISGDAIVGRTSTGALAAQSSAIAGESTVGRAATGDLISQSSVIDGSGTVEGAEVNDFPATGDLLAQASTIEGAVVVGRTSIGDLISQSATVSGSGVVGRVSTGDLISQSATMTADSTVGRVGTGDLISQDSVIDGSGTNSGAPEVVAVEVVERAKSSPRRRYRIIEDPDLLQEELRVEEKKVEVEKKKLRVLIKKSDSPNVEGVLYQQIQEKIEKLEAKIDDRLEKIAGLMLSIQVSLDEQDDDEEEVLLMS